MKKYNLSAVGCCIIALSAGTCLTGQQQHTSTTKAQAMVCYGNQQFDEAERIFRGLVEESEQKVGSLHPETLSLRNNLANTLTAAGRAGEGEGEHRAVLALREQVMGDSHPDTLSSRHNLAVALQAQGRHAEAEKQFQKVLMKREQLLGSMHHEVLKTCFALAFCLKAQGKLREAHAFALRAESGWKTALGLDNPVTTRAGMLCREIEDAQKLGKAPSAVQTYKEMK